MGSTPLISITKGNSDFRGSLIFCSFIGTSKGIEILLSFNENKLKRMKIQHEFTRKFTQKDG